MYSTMTQQPMDNPTWENTVVFRRRPKAPDEQFLGCFPYLQARWQTAPIICRTFVMSETGKLLYTAAPCEATEEHNDFESPALLLLLYRCPSFSVTVVSAFTSLYLQNLPSEQSSCNAALRPQVWLDTYFAPQ